MTITGYFECFQYLDFETNFLKNKKLFFKTGSSFLVESTTIENATFANIKTERTRSAKRTYYKERSFVAN